MPLFTVTMKSHGSTGEKERLSKAIHAASIAARYPENDLCFSDRSVHATARRDDVRMCTVVGAAGRELRNTSSATRLGRRICGEHADVDRVEPENVGELAARSIRTPWRWYRDGKSRDHG